MSEQDMENLYSSDESGNDLISTVVLHDIRDRNQTHPNVDKREARRRIRDRLKQRKSEWKGVLKAMHKMGKGLHKLFSTIVKDILQELTNFGESAVYHVSLNC